MAQLNSLSPRGCRPPAQIFSVRPHFEEKGYGPAIYPHRMEPKRNNHWIYDDATEECIDAPVVRSVVTKIRIGDVAKPPRALEYPPHGAWPCEMRAPMAAAFVGAASVNDFYRGVRAGIYPAPINRPHVTRKWSRVALEQNALGISASKNSGVDAGFDLDYELSL